jgi:hypothetical protein
LGAAPDVVSGSPNPHLAYCSANPTVFDVPSVILAMVSLDTVLLPQGTPKMAWFAA